MKLNNKDKTLSLIIITDTYRIILSELIDHKDKVGFDVVYKDILKLYTKYANKFIKKEDAILYEHFKKMILGEHYEI